MPKFPERLSFEELLNRIGVLQAKAVAEMVLTIKLANILGKEYDNAQFVGEVRAYGKVMDLLEAGVVKDVPSTGE